MKPKETKRKRILRRLTTLKNERQTWDVHWRECSEYLLPRRGRFQSSDANKGTKRNDKIINSVGPVGARTLAAGMMAGITSKSRPWFRLTTQDKQLAEVGPVKVWLREVEDRLREVFAASDIYLSLHTLYEDLLVFGTSVIMVDEDDDEPGRPLKSYVFPLGEYVLVANGKHEIVGFIREFTMTVGEVVDKFGLDVCSQPVKEQHNRGELETTLEVVHAVLPNDEYTPGREDRLGKRWASCWMERTAPDTQGMLRESGYEQKPFMAPRWHVQGVDKYGRSPGMDALPDAKGLQELEKSSLSVTAKIANPPMKGPASLQNRYVSLLPGDMTYTDSVAGGATYEPVYIPSPQALPALAEEKRQHEYRVKTALYAELWTMLNDFEAGKMTATEVTARVAEKKIQLGPVLERLDGELLNLLIDRSFAILARRGMLPLPPPELEGAKLKVEHVSILAQEQRSLEMVGVERTVAMVMQLAAVYPDILDKMDFDKLLEEYGAQQGLKPDLLRSAEAVQSLRQQRAQAQQAAQAAELAASAAQTGKTLADTPMEGDTGLSRVLSQFSGMGDGLPAGGALQ